MTWSDWLVPGSGVALKVAILVFLLRWRTWRSFPVYSIYVIFVLLQDLLLAATFAHPQSYYLAYWISTPVEILLTLLAALESFWRVLESFQLLRWFRFVLPGAILLALTYAAWQGYRLPPVQATRTGAAIINATVAAHYVIVTIAVLFLVLFVVWKMPWRIHEPRFLLGFGIASLAVAIGGWVRTVFGSKFPLVSQQAQPIGYLVALAIWLTAVAYPVPGKVAVPALSQEMLKHLKLQLRNLRSFVRRDGR